MRWKPVVVGLAMLGTVLAGCKQQCFLTEYDYNHYVQRVGLPDLDTNPAHSSIHAVGVTHAQAPPTVLDPEREIRYLSLPEAVALALEHGTVGLSSQNPGIPNDQLVGGQSAPGQGGNAVRVLALDPAIFATNIDASLSRFDVQWVTSLNWSNTDQPIGSAQQFFQSGGFAGGGLPAIESQDATAATSLFKRLPSGGVAGITFGTDYSLTNLPARVNPSYRPTLQFQFEQPLLQGFGVEINQLLTAPPSSQLGQSVQGAPGPAQFLNRAPQGLGGGAAGGIVLARLRFDQQRARFEAQVHQMLFNVEVAYWTLYGSYWNLYSREQALRQAYEAWKITNASFQAGRKSIAELAQTRGQYELFRSQRVQALGQVLESERRLRRLLGLPMEDGCRLVPSDEPTLSPYRPDWCTALNESLSLRPELVDAREELKSQQLNVIVQKNFLLPQLNLTSSYDITGIGSRLDGGDDVNAFRNLASNHFNNWRIGLQMVVPLGYREVHANLRAARLALARSYWTLRDEEDKAIGFLTLQYRQLFEAYELIQTLRSQRQAFAQQLQARFQEFIAGRGTLDILLEAQRFWADALANEYQAIVQYQNALAGFHFAKGTILQHDSVTIAEGPLPECAAVRAVENERRRNVALVKRERDFAIAHPPCDYEKGCLGLPALPQNKAPSLPSLLTKKPEAPTELPEAPTELPEAPAAKSDPPAVKAPPAAKPPVTLVTPPSPYQRNRVLEPATGAPAKPQEMIVPAGFGNAEPRP